VTPHEIGMVLAKAAIFDQRNVGDSDILAWHEILKEVDVRDALDAVGRHYCDSRERIMPTDILRLIPTMRHARQQQEHPCPRCGRVRSHEPDDSCGGPQAIEAGAHPPATGKALMREVMAKIADKLAVPDDDLDVSQIAPEVKRRHKPAAVRAIAEAQARVAQRQRDHHERLRHKAATGGPAWERSKKEPQGAWWEDPAARERHSLDLLAEAGRLHMHCSDSSCQQCSACLCGQGGGSDAAEA
jgi:hypothetical protein